MSTDSAARPAGTESPVTPTGSTAALPEYPPPTPRRPSGDRPEHHGPAWAGGLSGLVAAACAMAAAELAALLAGPGSVPVIAVGTALIPLTPESVKQRAISLFGTSDKTALIVGTCLLLAVVSVVAGVLARRRPSVGDAGIILFAGVGALAAARAGVGGVGSMIPSAVAAVVGVAVLRALLTRVRRMDPDAAGARDAPGARGAAGARSAAGGPRRRSVLYGLGSGTAAALAVGAAGLAGMRVRFGNGSARTNLALPAPTARATAQPAGVDPGVGAVPFQTDAADFYRIDTSLFVPHIDPASWQLRIHGMVDREITIDFATLLQRPLVERDITLTCVSNEVGGSLIGNARWRGAMLAPLLAEAGVSRDADQLVSRDAHGFSVGTPLSAVTDGRDAMLAVGMNGAPLPFEHGFPVRMVVPGLYGYVSACKWITDIEVTRFDAYDAYWVQRGWGARGPIKVSSRIDTPRSGRDRDAGQVTVAGVAWAQHTGIAKVEVRVDDGDWATATLAPVATADTWREWSWRWDAPGGDHRLAVRATTATGEVQTADEADTIPDGATGLHQITVSVNS